MTTRRVFVYRTALASLCCAVACGSNEPATSEPSAAGQAALAGAGSGGSPALGGAAAALGGLGGGAGLGQGGTISAGTAGSAGASGMPASAGASGAVGAAGTSGSAGALGGAGTSGAAGAGGGPSTPSFTTFWSGTVVATPSQQLKSATGMNTYRTYVRPRASGKFKWAFWVSNGTDSTYGVGEPQPNKLGGTWTIEAAYVADAGATHTGGVVAGSSLQVKFAGSGKHSVKPGDKFWSDPVEIDLPAGHDLAFTWTLSGTGYPYVSATFLGSYAAAGQSSAAQESSTGFSAVYGDLVAPTLFAYDRPVKERLCFLGDSITQGVGSSANSYGYWVAKIGASLSPEIGIWNLGSGWARAADAASDGYWLYKAKQCSQVALILGVNDFGSSGRNATQVLADLTTIVSKLEQNNPALKILLLTIPTFNFSGNTLDYWRSANTSIRTSPPSGVERVFDIAQVLSQPPPNDGLVQAQYHDGGDGHPNDAGSTAIANAFLAWYNK